VSGTADTVSLKYNDSSELSIATVTGGGTHFIFADDGKLLSEHTVQGALVRNYIYLNGVPFALGDGAGTVSYILNDQLGQPQKMLNTAGAVSWHRVAGIFGSTVSQPVGTTAANPQRFPGQQYDPNIALHYNYFRTYDPATGRYLEADPLGHAGGPNLYIYAEANPVSIVDPTGEYGIIGGLIGGGSDLLFQRYIEGKSWSCVSWTQAGGAAALGAFTGGAGRAVKLANDWRKAGRSMKTKNATRRYRRAMDVPPSHDVHHWLIPNKGGVSDAIKNNPLNYNPIPREAHQVVHSPQSNLLQKWWNGHPDWAKIGQTAPTAGIAADIADPDCGCE
jgi:RHS repeat-associated protein